MKNRVELSVEPRETGKHNSRALRNSKKVPAIVYGATENTCVYIEEKEVLRYNVRAYENALFNLKSSDKKANGKVVLMKSVDVHPLTRRPQHVDLFALDLTKSVRIFVEVRTEGKAIGISEGGLLNVVNRQVEVECLPTDIPEFFTLDVSNLGLNMALHVSDLALPKGLKMISSPELTIAVVNLAEEEVVATVDAAAPAAGAAAPAAGAAAPAAGAKAPASGAATPAAGAKAPAKK